MYNKVAVIQRRDNPYAIEVAILVENETHIIVNINGRSVRLSKEEQGNVDYILIKVRGGLTYNKKYGSIL